MNERMGTDMKKRILIIVVTLLLTLSGTRAVFADDQGSVSAAPDQSLELMFAKLQLSMAETNKEQAMEKMMQIEEQQAEQKKVAGFLNTARQCQSEAESSGEAVAMPADMAAYMDENGLSYDAGGDGLNMTAEEWETAITSLEAHLEALGSEMQQSMVYLQDYMGQYNSYIQGADPNPSNTNQTLTSLARGQSMYGNSGAGLTITALVVGLVLGSVITLAAQNIRRKRDKA